MASSGKKFIFDQLINSLREDKFINVVLDQSAKTIKKELKQITNGAKLEKNIDDNTTLDDLDKDPNAIWSILVLYGVLTFERSEKRDIYKIFTPNESTKHFLKEKIAAWEGLPAPKRDSTSNRQRGKLFSPTLAPAVVSHEAAQVTTPRLSEQSHKKR